MKIFKNIRNIFFLWLILSYAFPLTANGVENTPAQKIKIKLGLESIINQKVKAVSAEASDDIVRTVASLCNPLKNKEEVSKDINWDSQKSLLLPPLSELQADKMKELPPNNIVRIPYGISKGNNWMLENDKKLTFILTYTDPVNIKSQVLERQTYEKKGQFWRLTKQERLKNED